jgi:hypothetical protein
MEAVSHPDRPDDDRHLFRILSEKPESRNRQLKALADAVQAGQGRVYTR